MKTLLLIFLIFAAGNACAETFESLGKVNDILIRKSLENYAVIYVDGMNTAGTCPENSLKNLIILSIPADENAEPMYSLSLAAYMGSKSLSVGVDDSKKDSNGYCIIQSMRLNP